MNSKHYWQITLWALIILISLPILRILSAWLEPSGEIWAHLYATLLSDILTNTLWLLLGVGLGVTLLGVGLAWLVTMCEFPGRRVLEWMLFLPFAIPAYVLGFVFIGLFDYAGVVQSALRTWFDMGGLDIRDGRWAVMLVMTLVFYPYVYMLARNAFYSQNNSLIESARLLGLTPFGVFWRVSLPLARPAIAAGAMLSLMEVLADFGTVSMFNYNTLTSAIFSVWEDFRSLQTAAQLSTLLLGIAVLLIFIERWSRGRARYDTHQRLHARPYKLQGVRAWLVTGLVTIVVVLAFVLPVSQLLIWGVGYVAEEWTERYIDWISNSFILALGAALLTVGLAVLVNSVRQQTRLSWPIKLGLRFANLGYALPGSVLAVGIMLLIIDLGEWLAPGSGIWLSSGVLALLLAYMVRFLAVAYGPVESSFDTITPSMTEAARSLGASTSRLVSHVYFPLLKPGLVIAGFMVAVDVMKELPATYLLRPYGWDTLAIRVYELSAEGLYERAAIPSLILLLLGLLGLYMVSHITKRYKLRRH